MNSSSGIFPCFFGTSAIDELAPLQGESDFDTYTGRVLRYLRASTTQLPIRTMQNVLTSMLKLKNISLQLYNLKIIDSLRTN
jgi:hypothetical protein